MADEGNVEVSGFSNEIAELIRQGDSDAEARLVAAYLPGIRVLVRKHCRPNDPVLDDIVQEVLMRVLMHLRAGEVRDCNALPAYMRSMVANIAIAEYRRRERTGHFDPSEFLDTLADTDDGPEYATDREHISGQVSRLLAELPVERDREILLRHYVKEQDLEQVCTEMKISKDLYRRVLFRARERLRRLAELSGLREH